MIKNTNNKKKKKGFTLIELIIVIAIIAILAAVAIPKFGQVRKNANIKADVANAKTISNAVTTLMAEEKLKPGTEEGEGVYVEGTAFDILDTANKPGKTVVEYLQTTPTGKNADYKNKNFKVVVDSTGGVKIYLPATGTDTLVYPGATGDYLID